MDREPGPRPSEISLPLESSLMGPQMYYSVLGIPNLLKLISEAGCICRHLEYDQYPELHLYVIAQRT